MGRRQRRMGRLGCALVLAATAVVPFASAATAAPSEGCRGQAVSTEKDGRLLDKATAPGRGGTNDDPFHVDVNGKVAWRGSTDAVIRNGSYEVSVAGWSVASGDFKNAKGKRSWSGTEDVGRRLGKIPVLGWLTKTLKPTATLQADYEVTGRGGACSGSVVIKIGDDPTFTPLWLTSIVLFLLAFWMLFRPRTLLGE